MKFHVIGNGDSSVGIPASDWYVDFDTDLSEDDIKNIKEFLIEFDDNITRVYTEDEEREMQQAYEEIYIRDDEDE